LTVFVLAAAARAEVLSAPPVTLPLAGQTLPALLFAALLGLGAVLQAAGVYRPNRAAALIGAALVVCAGLFDRDPVLVVGQIVLVAALCPASKKKDKPDPQAAAQRWLSYCAPGRSFQDGMGGGV